MINHSVSIQLICLTWAQGAICEFLSTSPLLSLSWQLQVLPNGNVFSPGCKTCNVSCTSLSDDSWGIRFLNLEHRHTWMTTKMITTTEHMSNNYSLITKNLKHDLRWWMKHYLNNHLYISVSTYHQWILVMPTSVTVDLSLWHHFGITLEPPVNFCL